MNCYHWHGLQTVTRTLTLLLLVNKLVLSGSESLYHLCSAFLNWLSGITATWARSMSMEFADLLSSVSRYAFSFIHNNWKGQSYRWPKWSAERPIWRRRCYHVSVSIIRVAYNRSLIFIPPGLLLLPTGTTLLPWMPQVRYDYTCLTRYNEPTMPFLDAWFAGGPEPIPDSGLINGVGRYNGGPQVPWARINVIPGKRYRLRLISLSASGWVTSFYKSNVNVHQLIITHRHLRVFYI